MANRKLKIADPVEHFNKVQYNFVKEVLRKSTFKWKPRTEAIRQARADRLRNPLTGKLCWHVKCANCHKVFLERECKVDHIEPVVPIEKEIIPGFAYNPELTQVLKLGQLAYRMVCKAEQLQILCEECHNTKTAWEAAARAEQRCLQKEREEGK